ncbi:hypothetical protein [Pseudoduganella violaceinigra]|uniref:hypothetical protein n=1 Tax=Pseudoduganella violaceinigra TaxID=246602 RepID=UPI0012B545E1|nr:hypothetical protein [Pseudoduganella violaceinigra]
MDLATHQRILLGLMRATYQPGPGDAPYYHRVAGSVDLREARGNVYLWRVYVLERSCVLTVELLRRRGMLEEALQAFIRQQNISPFREYQPLAFLDFLAGHGDALVVSVSQFELALMKVREGDPGCHIVDWSHDPAPILHALAQGAPLPASPRLEPHRTEIRRDLPHLFAINSVARDSANSRSRFHTALTDGKRYRSTGATSQ